MESSSTVQIERLAPPSRLQQSDGPSVWLEFSPLAQIKKAVNCGQGFPGWAPPEFVTAAAAKAVTKPEFSQYARSSGHMPLVEVIAEKYGPRLGRSIQADREVLVTAGCSEAIFLGLMALVEAGDEVVLFEPAFDIYKGAVAMLGAKCRPVGFDFHGTGDRLSLKLNPEKLRRAINEKTKVIILNSPHNPSGKVMTRDELSQIAELLREYPKITVLSDEVYEHILYKNNKHVSIANFEGMQERTVAMYSVGKTFSVTGWKIGWCIGPSEIIGRMQQCQQWVMFSVSTPLQAAVAESLVQAEKPFEGHENYYAYLKDSYERKHDTLKDILQGLGGRLCETQGSFFHLLEFPESINPWLLKAPENYKKFAAVNRIAVNEKTLDRDDYNLCRNLCIDAGVAAIPVSAFYCNQQDDTPKRMLRFAFCKTDEELLEAGRRLRNFSLHD